MGYAILAFDGADKTRRAAAMDRHRAVISRWAEDGRMPFGTPLFTAEWVPSGSLMILDVPDMAGVQAYLSEEPFSVEGVWGDIRILPFRIAALPYQRLPKPGDPMATTHSPTRRRAGSPVLSIGRLADSILTSATSVRRSEPIRRPLNSRLSVSVT